MNCEECDEEIPEKRVRALLDWDRNNRQIGLPGRIMRCIRCQEKHDKRVGIKDVGDSLANNEWEGW